MAGNFKVEAEVDASSAIHGIDREEKLMNLRIRHLLTDGSEYAAQQLRIRIPHQSYQSRATIHNKPAERTAFGYEAVAGALDIPGSHVKYFYEGTGIWGRRGAPYGPTMKKAMMFYTKGRGPLFRTSVKGQKPQKEWVEDSFARTGNFVHRSIARIGNNN